MDRIARTSRRLAALMLSSAGVAMAADPFTFATVPLFLAPPVKPNVMVVFDNSQSMDATMSGMVVSGNSVDAEGKPITRGNIARGVLRGVLDGNRSAFNWGLTTFATGSVGLYDTHAFYLGDATTMVYTNNCVDGISSDNNMRCVANPDIAVNGFSHITYAKSGDDFDINDVTYHAYNPPDVLHGIGGSGTTYSVYGARAAGSGTAWTAASFNAFQYTGSFSATDAGFLASASTYPRRLWIRRGKGYYANVTGLGTVVETVQTDSTTHFNNLQSLLANETLNTGTNEIKNAATFTAIAGSLKTVKDYFASGISDSKPSPISETCQANFVVLATDGNPTARTDGSLYSAAERANTFNASTNTWTFGQAQQDVFSRIAALRSTRLDRGDLSNNSLDGRTFDIKTYVIGMGDSVANPSSVAALNEMARRGRDETATAFLGSSQTALSSAFESIVGDIQNKTGTASSAAVNASAVNANSRVYLARFKSKDWSGDLLAYPISLEGVVSGTPAWQAGPKLALQVQDTGWSTGRHIVTYKPSADLGERGIPFRWPAVPVSPGSSELDVAQSNLIGTNAAGTADAFGAERLAFLRGDVSREQRNCSGCSAPVFRNRPSGPLGDIVNSTPLFVGAPSFGYLNEFEAVPYNNFVGLYRNRTPMLYVGANDGMLHGFNAETGAEVFSYVPSALFPTLSKLSGSSYNHGFYADGSPASGDVFYGGAWHTLLVSGMRSGAKGVFALDITNPASFSEANAGSIVRWEFQDPDLGHVYGQPLIVKTNNGKWSVIVAGGYNAGGSPATGRAMLFVLDAETGALVKRIDTAVGTLASPNGLSAPTAIDVDGNDIVDIVYAGDLNGNLWKFDLSSAAPASWVIGNGGSVLFSTGGKPITSAPDVTAVPNGRPGYLVAFGTGRYLANADNTSTSGQSIYAIWDNLTTGTVTQAQLQQQNIVETRTISGVRFRLSSHAVGTPADTNITGADNLISTAGYYSTKRGWYLNLPTSGERVVTDVGFRGGRLTVTSMIPDASSPCAFGGSGWLLEFNAFTGNRLGTPTIDTNGDDAFDSADNLTFDAGKAVTSGLGLDGIPAGVTTVRVGKNEIALIGTTKEGGGDGPCQEVVGLDNCKKPPPTSPYGRAMWREIR
jgi:type IV pilus assembly protein PilY1